MKSSDPASLQNLNDIVLPAPVGWWPLAGGWYFLLGLLLALFAWFCYRSVKRWQQNAYRRAAIQELSVIARGLRAEATRQQYLRQIPGLLKRTALAAYPRSEVASLSGEDWHRFLNGTLKKPLFTGAVSSTLELIAYSSEDLNKLDSSSVDDLVNASGHWLKKHRDPASSRDSGET
jgi:hypothetical protein